MRLCTKTIGYPDYVLQKQFFQNKIPQKREVYPLLFQGRKIRYNEKTDTYREYTEEEKANSLLRSLQRTKQQVYDLVMCNEFNYFCTLTFSNLYINRNFDHEVNHAYEKFINNLRKQFSEMRYISVPERHKSGAIHFHMLIGGMTPSQLGLIDSTKKDKKGRPIYNITKFKYGFTTATEIGNLNATRRYLLKYITKDNSTIPSCKKRFYASKNLKTPLISISYAEHDTKPYSLAPFNYKTDIYALRSNCRAKFHFNIKWNILTINIKYAEMLPSIASKYAQQQSFLSEGTHSSIRKITILRIDWYINTHKNRFFKKPVYYFLFKNYFAYSELRVSRITLTLI